MNLLRRRLLVVLGPTSIGKTDLALQLAHKFQGELISVDSRQVYRGLDIGTGKLPGKEVAVKKGEGFWEMNGIKIWMYDVVDPKKQYSVFDYVKDAGRVIEEIRKRGKLPIIVGGTGLYLKALLEGLSNLSIPSDKKLRGQLQKFTKQELQEKLMKIALKRWEAMNFSDRENPRRLVRAIELVISPRTSPYGYLRGISASYNILKIGLTAPREALYKKINDKILELIQERIVDEVSKLIKKGLSKKRLMELGLEYAVVLEYLEKKISLDQMIEQMQNKVRQYARRQITWFKKEKNVFWFNVTGEGFAKKIEKLISKWYNISKYAAES